MVNIWTRSHYRNVINGRFAKQYHYIESVKISGACHSIGLVAINVRTQRKRHLGRNLINKTINKTNNPLTY